MVSCSIHGTERSITFSIVITVSRRTGFLHASSDPLFDFVSFIFTFLVWRTVCIVEESYHMVKYLELQVVSILSYSLS